MVSNDSDLVEPIEQVQRRFGVMVGIVMPILNGNRDGSARKPSTRLLDAAAFDRRIIDSRKRRRLPADSQFPDSVQTAAGTVTKPAGW